jgi:hypothetical protein
LSAAPTVWSAALAVLGVAAVDALT